MEEVPCVEIEKPKRKLKGPNKFTPEKIEKTRMKLEKKYGNVVWFVLIGAKETASTRRGGECGELFKTGLLKIKAKTHDKYKKNFKNMGRNPLNLEGFKGKSKA